MTKFIRNIKLDIIKCFSYWNVGIIFVNLEYCCKNRTLCGTICIKKFIALWRIKRNKLLSTYRKIFQALAVHFKSKLSSNLCCHEGVSNSIFFKVTLKSDEIQADFFRDNMKLGTICKCTVNIHHRSIKAK